MPRLPLLAAVCLASLAVPFTASAETNWIWTDKNNVAQQQTWARQVIELKEVPASATLLASADNHVEAWVNGQPAGKSDDWADAAKNDVTKLLKVGRNTITVLARNDTGIAAVVVRLEAGKKILAETDATWRVTNTKPDAQWSSPAFDDAKWSKAVLVKPLGSAPWGQVFAGAQPVAAKKGGRGTSGSVAAPESLLLPPGFKAELLYTVPRAEQGSWVSLVADPKGDFIAGDQGGTLWHVGMKDPLKPMVTKIETTLVGAHGLLYAHGALYALTAEKGKGDLWRLRDPKGDNSYSEQTKLRSFQGSGEHGPHQLILDPKDGSLLVVAGNHTKMPADEVPAPTHRWDEDDLLKKFEDPNGHAAGIKATGGWIGRIDKDGKNFRAVTTGFRNAYDVSRAPDGDLFVYDSDMEWDMGAPWYRPTRIYLATEGGELGWRSGSGNNQPMVLDAQPALVDVGPGSPTGSAIGLGAQFPAKYQRAFFACDWTFATLYAIHLTPNGGGWTATKEVFAGGKPFSVTDVIIREQDRQMYVTIGGRGGQSALYRITYTGTESTAAVEWYPSTPEQKIRRELEALRLQPASAANLELGWKNLGHADRWVRFAARQLVEAQPVEGWRNRVGGPSTNPVEAVTAALALARCGNQGDLESILKALDQAAPARIFNSSAHKVGGAGHSYNVDNALQQQRDILRVMQVAFSRHGAPSPARAKAIGADAAKRLPSGDNVLDRQLALIAIFLQEPTAPAKILQTMKVASHGAAVEADPEVLARNGSYSRGVQNAMAVTPASTRLGLAIYLVRATAGWTPETRKQFFGFLDELGAADGGHSLKGFVKNIRKEAVATAPAGERAALEAAAPVAKTAPIPTAAGPGRLWTHPEAAKVWATAMPKKEFDFENGKKMFSAALCSQCHRVGDLGGAQAPDLSGVGARMNAADLLMSIIQPSAVVSDQYANSEISRVDGGKVIGRILNEEGDKLQLAVSAFDPSVQVSVNRSDIIAIDRSAISPMPVGLINAMNEKELADLTAFLLSGGNAKDKLYSK